MKPLVLLFWIFAVPVLTSMLQPSVNVTVLQNVSAEGDLLMNSEEEDKIQGVKELGIKETKRLEQARGSTVDVEEKVQQQELSLDEPDALDVNTPIHSISNSMSLQGEEGEEHLLPVLLASATPSPSPPFNSTLSSETTVKSQKLYIAEAIGANLLINESSTNDELKVELHVMNISELHLKEEVSLDVTALAARAGPTETAPPSTLKDKPKNKVASVKLRDNKTLKVKKKKPRKTNKVLKKTKKVKKLKHERKLKPTTPSHFPYFEDHYCPSKCSCYGRVVQCSDKHLDKIPYGIPYSSRYILLMNNIIDSIQLNLLSQYELMEFLVLRNNRLTDSAVKGTFEGIQSLKRLYLERNHLRSIPTDLPATLEELRLDRNQISVMSNAAFERCPSLQILSLSNNSLGNKSIIPPGVLLPLGKLQTLTLSYNQLASVPLQLPLSLRELYLRGNHIQRLQGDMFWGEAELLMLDVSLNRLTDKGLGKASLLNASHLESLNLEGNLLKQVPRHLPRTIKTLNLEGNFISSISKDAFILMSQLEHLGLARNKITKVALGAFRVLPLLHQLDMSHNALQQVPRQLPLWLHSATFMHNKIHSIPRDAFCWGRGSVSPMSRLVKVQLEYNLVDLGHLDTLAFRCLRGFQVVQFY